jgi:transposase
VRRFVGNARQDGPERRPRHRPNDAGGMVRAVHVKGVETQRMRTLLANRRLLKRKLIELENHIRGALRAYGLRVGHVSRGNFEDRVRELMEHADYVFTVMITTLLEVRRTVLEGYNKLHKILLQVVIHDPLCRRFMGVPGVGPVAALTFKVAVEDPRRFARSRTVGAYFGLTPRHHQSGTSIDFTGHISKMGDLNARGALCEAAASLLLRSRRWSALKAWGMRIAKRQSMMCAIVAVARKLAAILHRLWIKIPMDRRRQGHREDQVEASKSVIRTSSRRFEHALKGGFRVPSRAGRAPGGAAKQSMSAILPAPPGDGTRAPLSAWTALF